MVAFCHQFDSGVTYSESSVNITSFCNHFATNGGESRTEARRPGGAAGWGGGGYLYSGGKNRKLSKTASWENRPWGSYESRPPCYSALGLDPFGAFFSIKRKLGDWT